MTTFVTMYHPALNNVRVQAPAEAEALYEAHGWVLDGGVAPPPADIYLTPALGDLRYAALGSGGGGAALTDAAMAAALGASTATAMAGRTELKAAYVAVPTGGTDGQALVKSGASVVWGAGGGGISVADNGDGTASTTSSSVADNGDGTALAA